MKCRVFKKPDGSVFYSWPSANYQNDFSKAKFPDFTNGLPYIDLNDDDLIESDSNTGNYHEMIYFSGKCTKKNLKQDKGWTECLMPHWLIADKHQFRLQAKIDKEFTKSKPSTVKILQLQRELEKSQNWKGEECFECYEQALANLDGAKVNKPTIRKKLEDKIAELKRK